MQEIKLDIPKEFDWKQEVVCRSICKELAGKRIDPFKVFKVRKDLNDRRSNLLGTPKHKTLDAALWALKQIAEGGGIEDACHDHLLSDHAVLRYLEREEGFNLTLFKDNVLQKIKQRGKIHNLVVRKNRFVTYLNQGVE